MAESAGGLTWAQAHRGLVPLMKADNSTNIGYLLLEYAGIVLTLALGTRAYAAWTDGTMPTWAFVAVAPVVMMLAAVFQHRLSGLGHEAGHYTMFRNKLANDLVSDIFCMFPLMAMTQRFRATHLDHHRFVNDPERDPDRVRLTSLPADKFPMPKGRFWTRYVAESLWPPLLLHYLYGQAKNANVGGPKMKNVYSFRIGRGMRGAYWLTVLTFVHAFHLWPIFFLFWVAPLLTFYPFLMQLREIAHHSNAPDDGDLTNSRVFLVHPLVSACIFPYGQAYHVTHHMFAMLPHYRMARAHRLLQDYPPYRDEVIICRGYFFPRLGTKGPTVLDVLAERRHEPATVAV